MREIVQNQLEIEQLSEQEDAANIRAFVEAELGDEAPQTLLYLDRVRLIIKLKPELTKHEPHTQEYVAKAGVPRSQREKNTADKGAAARFLQTPETIEGARASAYKKIEGYMDDAATVLSVLQEVEGTSVIDAKRIDVDKLHDNRHAKYVLADMLMDLERLNEQKWPNKKTHHYKERQQFWRGFVLVASELDDPRYITEPANELLVAAYRRFQFWAAQLREIQQTRGGVAVLGQLIGAESPDSQKIGTLKHNTTQIPVKVVESEPPQTPATTSEMPESVHRELVRDYVARQEEIDKQERRGKARITAEIDVLGGPGIYDKDGNLIGFEPSLRREMPTTEALVRSELDKKARRERWLSKQR